MKKYLCFLLAIFISFNCFSKEFDLCDNAVIIVSENPSSAELYAANLLASNIEKITNKELPIISDTYPNSSFYISVGNNFFNLGFEPKQNDGSYIIKSLENGIAVKGTGYNGIVYGAYRFLEEFCGYNFFTAEQGLITKNYNVLISDNINISYVPYFEYTDTDWTSPKNPDYSQFYGLNSATNRKIPSDHGSTVKYISNFAHTMTSQFCASNKYFLLHPEYYAIHNGKRTKDQLCLTNPDVKKIVLAEVKDLLEKKHDPNSPLQLISLSQADNMNYCECYNCNVMNASYRSYIGTILHFVNDIAQEIKALGYDNVSLVTYAYQYSRKPPINIKPADNVIIQLSSIECCFNHPLYDTTCQLNAEFYKDLLAWNEITNRIYIWNYSTNYVQTCGPFPNLDVIQKNIQFFYEHGVKGIYDEGNYYMYRNNTEFGELRSFLISKCLQNPYCDLEKARYDFLQNYYGNAAQYLNEYLSIICKPKDSVELKISSLMRESLSLTPTEIFYCNALWEMAKSVELNEPYISRILQSELSWRYWKCFTKNGEFSKKTTYNQNKKILYNDILNTGLKGFYEGSRNNSYYIFKRFK